MVDRVILMNFPVEIPEHRMLVHVIPCAVHVIRVCLVPSHGFLPCPGYAQFVVLSVMPRSQAVPSVIPDSSVIIVRWGCVLPFGFMPSRVAVIMGQVNVRENYRLVFHERTTG